jgi:hypothetical protein
MDEFTASQAAAWLGVTREAVDLAAREGRLPVLDGDGPRRFSRETLEAYHQARVRERVAALARNRETPASVAVRVRTALHRDELGMPRPVAVKLAAMPDAWRSLFSRAELAAACTTDGCKWCEAQKFGDFLGLRPVEFAPALRELFGADPCRVCGPALLGPYMAVLAARVHPPGTRAPEAPPRPSAGEQERAREWVQQRAVTAAVKPVQDDGGRSLVARRRREVQAALKDARRRKDTKHALALQKQLQSLVADAARVDGRSAAARPGVLRCGHALAQGCSCPRRASARGRS